MPTVLLNKKTHPQKQNIYQHQSKHTKNGEAHGGVRQDKSGNASDRTASHQPASDSQGSDRGTSATKPPRSKSESTPSRAKVPFTLHVDPILKADVERQAGINGNSASAEGAALLEEMVRQKIHKQQAATLETTLERLMAKFYRRLAARLTYFLTIIAFDTGHSNLLANNILGMQQGMTQELLKDILKDADKRTKARLSRKNPELAPFMDAIEKWLLADEEEPPPGHGTNGHTGRGGSR
jgi:predicted kinase